MENQQGLLSAKGSNFIKTQGSTCKCGLYWLIWICLIAKVHGVLLSLAIFVETLPFKNICAFAINLKVSLSTGKYISCISCVAHLLDILFFSQLGCFPPLGCFKKPLLQTVGSYICSFHKCCFCPSIKNALSIKIYIIIKFTAITMTFYPLYLAKAREK